MLKGFKEFAMKGNVIDLAVGVVIGGAFGKIVTSLVNDIIMPLVGLVLGNIDFSNLVIVLGKGWGFTTLTAAKALNAEVVTLNYGIFINNIIDFTIIAFSIFLIVKQLNRFSKKKEVVIAITTKQCKYCYGDMHIDATRCPHCTSVVD